jgi:hypothetical protein
MLPERIFETRGVQLNYSLTLAARRAGVLTGSAAAGAGRRATRERPGVGNWRPRVRGAQATETEKLGAYTP